MTPSFNNFTSSLKDSFETVIDPFKKGPVIGGTVHLYKDSSRIGSYEEGLITQLKTEMRNKWQENNTNNRLVAISLGRHLVELACLAETHPITLTNGFHATANGLATSLSMLMALLKSKELVNQTYQKLAGHIHHFATKHLDNLAIIEETLNSISLYEFRPRK